MIGFRQLFVEIPPLALCLLQFKAEMGIARLKMGIAKARLRVLFLVLGILNRRSQVLHRKLIQSGRGAMFIDEVPDPGKAENPGIPMERLP